MMRLMIITVTLLIVACILFVFVVSCYPILISVYNELSSLIAVIYCTRFISFLLIYFFLELLWNLSKSDNIWFLGFKTVEYIIFCVFVVTILEFTVTRGGWICTLLPNHIACAAVSFFLTAQNKNTHATIYIIRQYLPKDLLLLR